MKLLGVVPADWHALVRAAPAAVACASLVLLVAGCGAVPATSSHRTEVVVRSVRVPVSSLGVDAEQLANQHEGDYTLAGIGESMEPVYSAGTILVVHPTSFFMLHAGMPVVYRNHRGHAVAHVLVEKVAAGWIAKGLNNAQPDDEPVTTDNLMGVIRCAFVPDTSVAMNLGADSGFERGIALLH